MSTYKQCDARGYLEGNVENSLREELGLEDEDVYIAWISAVCGIRGKSRAGVCLSGSQFLWSCIVL